MIDLEFVKKVKKKESAFWFHFWSKLRIGLDERIIKRNSFFEKSRNMKTEASYGKILGLFLPSLMKICTEIYTFSLFNLSGLKINTCVRGNWNSKLWRRYWKIINSMSIEPKDRLGNKNDRIFLIKQFLFHQFSWIKLEVKLDSIFTLMKS